MQGERPTRRRPYPVCPSVRLIEGPGVWVGWERPSGPCPSPPSPPRPQRTHRRVLLPAGLGPECSRPASVIGNRWMGGGRRPALPPVAIRDSAGREREGGGGVWACGDDSMRACQARRGHVPGQVWGWQKRGLAPGAES